MLYDPRTTFICPVCGTHFQDTEENYSKSKPLCPKCKERHLKEILETSKWFQEKCKEILLDNIHKNGWKNCSLNYLIGQISNHLQEIEEANSQYGKKNIDHNEWQLKVIDHCCDIANFAMMVADVTCIRPKMGEIDDD